MTDAELRALAEDAGPMPFRLHVLALLDRIDALTEALQCAEEQWGDDYLWKKWDLSSPLRVELRSP